MTARADAAVPARTRDDPVEATPADLFALLADEHAREILACVVDDPKSARAIVADCDCSRPTVYRRLERLSAVGLVATARSIDPDGHHRKVFRSRLDGLSVDLRADGWSVTVDATDPL